MLEYFFYITVLAHYSVKLKMLYITIIVHFLLQFVLSVVDSVYDKVDV